MQIKYLFLIIYISVINVIFSQYNVKLAGNLPDQLSESSGLIFYDNKVVMHNDSGNAPELFELDPITMKIVRTVTIANAENVDWEDMTQDAQYIYIGDFGNHRGIRKDLCIYKVSKAAFDASTTVRAEKIYFSYPDQPTARTAKSDFDAEALFSLESNLVILTKQWNSQGTTAYRISKDSGAHIATNMGKYHSNGMITGVTYNEKAKKVVMVGYNLLMLPFIIEVSDFSYENLFSGTVKRTNLEIGFIQAEGITTLDDKNYFISSESFPIMGTRASLFSFSIED